ncbi:MAG: cryptochrome/photolyase family protein [Candidatus Brocadiia bacterium]
MGEDLGGDVRNLVLVLGDQLDATSAAFDGFDNSHDAVWMAEVPAEAAHVRSHKARIALFLSAMRHFRDSFRAAGKRVVYRKLNDAGNRGDLAAELVHAMRELAPVRLVMVQPGEWRVHQSLRETAQEFGTELDVRPDRHFLCSRQQFAGHMEGRRRPVMEYFYREMRRRTGHLMDGDQPVGGEWNYDKENREAFGKSGPSDVPGPRRFPPDDVTRAVIRLVKRRFADHPGSLEQFDWPVTHRQARTALRDFVGNRLRQFGRWQDAMWTGEPFLFHSRLSSALNLKLLGPRHVLEAAEAAYAEGDVPINSAEGFVRQILGWREFVRGIYWHHMPDYLHRNALDAHQPLPAFYWNAETDMSCLRECIGQTLKYGYAHHIQRLMVTGLFALLLGVEPREVHRWYLAVYVDAVEWVELPNTLGMSQFADGGIIGTKPYVATGKYIERMSNYCDGCRYRPGERTGDDACPFTTLYWDFLMRHARTLSGNSRMGLQLRNLDRVDSAERRELRGRAEKLRASMPEY